MKLSPVFIVGVGRSGTTLIRQMINNHSKIAIPYESHFITKYLEQMSQYGDLQQDDKVRRLIVDICNEPILANWDFVPTVDDVFDALSERTLAAVIDAFFCTYAKHHGKVRWGDKSDYLDRMYQIKQVFPNARFIHIIRDGRDVALSVLKMSWGPRNIRDAAEWWGTHVKLGRAMGRMLEKSQYFEVKYEELVSDPQGKLAEICEFIGVEFEPEMLEFYKTSKTYIPQNLLHQHYNADSAANTSRLAAWLREMSNVDAAIFQQMAGDVLTDLGYPSANQPVSSFKRRLRSLMMLLKLA